MSASLSREEHEVVLKLRDAGVSLPAATLAVVLVTREHARPEQGLAHIVRQYQHLDDATEAEQAIVELKRLGWLVEFQSYGQYLVRQAANLRDKLAEKTQDPALPNQLLSMRSTFEPNIRIFGAMSDIYTYESYLDLLRSAQSEICLPMLATTPELSAVPILQDRARKGVRVRILLGTPEVVAKLRGETMRHTAEDSIKGWCRNARGIRQISIKLAHSVDDMLLATCMTIDGRVLRFDVYDPARQRSLEGVMLEINSPTGLSLNLVTLFQKHFDDAWNRAKPLHLLGKLGWYIARAWQWWLLLLFVGLSYIYSADPIPFSIFASCAASFLVGGIVSAWPSIRSFLVR